MQQNWIGRSEGVELAFDISHYNLPERSIKVFTTRPDTVFGVTFMVLAPEHPLVEKLTSPQEKATVEQYVTQARRASEVERMSTDREKTGVPIGAYCVNPFNGERVPLYIADYVLATYGTGAVMAVPAHDERDFAFAHKNNLPVKIVIKPKGWDGMQLKAAYTEPGEMMNSDELTGTSAEKALDAVANLAERKHIGKRTISYRIRDWLISRQRYWGTPIPVVYCPTDGIVPLSEKDLPVLLPEDAQFKPTGESPLKFHQGFLNTTCPKCHGPAKRETDTMDTFVDSSWYFLRYASPKYDKGPFDPALAKKWAPVDQYTGGAEHAVMHLLYSRFFTKALHDLKLIDFDEPFKRLFNQGIILGEDHEKMSKSRGNVVNPDDFVGRDGADTVRLFLMFVGPWDQGANWSTTGIQGMSRWLTRAWGLATRSAAEHDWKSDNQAIEELERTTHKTVKRVTASLEKFSFNTAIAAMMEFTNELQKYWEGNAVSEGAWKASIEKLLVLMAPFTPHVAEELWEATGRSYSIHQQPWPAYDAEKAKDTEVTLIIQVNGKLRDKFTVSADVTEEQAKALALKSDKVTSMLVDGKQVRKVIYVPGKLVNVVVG